MIGLNDIRFSVHEYDRDGDISNMGIYLHFGEGTRVWVANDLEGFERVARRILEMVEEIRENHDIYNI